MLCVILLFVVRYICTDIQLGYISVSYVLSDIIIHIFFFDDENILSESKIKEVTYYQIALLRLKTFYKLK